MVGWYHQLDGHESEHAPGDGEVQADWACCSPWGRKQLDTNKQVNNKNDKLVEGKKSAQIVVQSWQKKVFGNSTTM